MMLFRVYNEINKNGTGKKKRTKKIFNAVRIICYYVYDNNNAVRAVMERSDKKKKKIIPLKSWKPYG